MNEREPPPPAAAESAAEQAIALGRQCFAQRSWADAFEHLCRADAATPLEAEVLELLAISAYLTGRDDDFIGALDRAHGEYLKAGQPLRAARCAFWLGFNHLLKGEMGQGGGWLSGARRLIEREAVDCVEAGYLLVPTAELSLGGGDRDAAFATASDAAGIGERFDEPDLIACARHLQGRALIRKGRVDEGLGLLDEAMVAVTRGELSPLMTGLIYCSVIEECQRIYAFGRASEWTGALAAWCESQPQLVAFTGQCLIHRAEIFQLRGNWEEAIAEARRAVERFSARPENESTAAAFYQQGEVHRLRGEFKKAEEAYTKASRLGGETQPGLALLRLAQNRGAQAEAAIRRVLESTAEGAARTKYLPAYVEIMVAVGKLEDARRASRELDEIAALIGTDVIVAMAAHARGAVEIAAGDVRDALTSLRAALAIWRRIEVPYPAAHVRALMARGYRMLADQEGAQLELAAAQAVFERLGATHDIGRVDPDARAARAPKAFGLTRRELQVLALVANGKTNKAIAAELCVSRKTIDRHLSNIFNKLDVPSRAAATAFAYENGLL